MDVVMVSMLAGVGFALSTLLWHLRVQPEVVVSLFRSRSLTDEGSHELDPRVVRGLQWVLGGLVVAVGFLTGAALSFLAATS